MSYKHGDKRIKKFNGGRGAILCNNCRVILMSGFYPDGLITKEAWESDDPILCKVCEFSQKVCEPDAEQSVLQVTNDECPIRLPVRSSGSQPE